MPDVLEEESLQELKIFLKTPTSGFSFLEKLLLAIIDGHTVKGVPRNKRLQDAMIALTGKYYHKGLKDADDRVALLWMASEIVRKSNQEKTTTELAREASHKFNLSFQSEESTIRRLTKKFKQKRDALITEVKYAEMDVHRLEHEFLMRIKEEFDLMDIAFVLPLKPSAF